MLRLTARSERWPLSRPFRIARGVKTAADVVVVEAVDGAHAGSGEAVPYARYGESVESVLTQIAAIAGKVQSREELQRALPPGAARNAVDCALWDMEAQLAGRSIASLNGLQESGETITAVTVSLDEPARMAKAAAALATAPLIKVKVDANAPLDAVRAVRTAVADARLIVDPNESWTMDLLRSVLPALADLKVDLIEQPIPADQDAALENFRPGVPLCADESAHTSADLERVARRYQAVNIKLDKTGGLTEALAMRDRVLDMGLTLMVGCMVSTSLGVAPALLVANGASFVDLDGPWWLAEDREICMKFEDGRMRAPRNGWGQPRGA